MVNKLTARLVENSRSWGIPGAGPWRFWLYNNSHAHCTNMDVMWFQDSDEFPRVVTKLDSKPGILAREFENLSMVYSCAPDCVPRPLAFGPVDDFWALWMEGLPGLPFRRTTSAENLLPIVQMLVRLHSAVRQEPSEPGRYRREVVDPIQAVAQFGDSAIVRAACDHLLRTVDEKWIQSLPVIPQHGDLCAGNVISFRGEPRVVDWETFGKVNLPFFDLFTFLVSLIAPDGVPPESPDPDLFELAPALIDAYAQGIGVDACTSNLLPLVLVNWFHLMWKDGRANFTARMYRLIEHVFRNPDFWQSLFLPATAGMLV
jgi:hypothetical protein